MKILIKHNPTPTPKEVKLVANAAVNIKIPARSADDPNGTAIVDE